MTSNLECVGLAVRDAAELDSLVRRLKPEAVEIGRTQGLKVLRWEDASGARLVLGVYRDDVVDLLPSFAGLPRTRLHGLSMVNDEVAIAAVLDDAGEQLTSAAMEVEERRLLPVGDARDCLAAIVALGVDVSVFADPDDFERSDASLLSTEDRGSEPPTHYVEQGWKWPPRVAASSFFSFGVFGDPAAASAHARLTGVVRNAERRVVQATGQAFIMAEVTTAGFEVTLCIPDGSPMPVHGGVISGRVLLTASLDELSPRRAKVGQGLFGRLFRSQRD